MHRFVYRTGKFLLKFVLVLLVIVLTGILLFRLTTKIELPKVKELETESLKRESIEPDFYKVENNWIQKNKHGLWEMYVEGEAYKRGVVNGMLSKELIYKQEDAFVKQIKTMIPSESYLKFLKTFIAFFNRNIDEHITEEYQKEIYGISKSASNQFDFIAPNYHRILNYHGAHDIGHALQNMNLVACTAFAGWDSKSADSSLIIGRNFDFFVGDEFAEDKIVMFCNPEKGYPFMMVTWGGMIGATSGMNKQGLTVTINAAKSGIPFSAATPVSLVAREILQYASNIEEAFAIAEKRKMFVSESLFIGSAKDRKTATIEKSPDKQMLLMPEDDFLICSNHFQNEEIQNKDIVNSPTGDYATLYRFEKVKNLLDKTSKLDVSNTAQILRDQKGLKGENIGMGNEKAINQLIAHHSVIFKPEELKVWLSTKPFQLGEYICYDLNKVFKIATETDSNTVLFEQELTIPADSFLYSQDYSNFLEFKNTRNQVQMAIKNNKELSNLDSLFPAFRSLNPEFFETYVYIADYYKHFNMPVKAVKEYKKALSKEIPNIYQRESIESKIEELQSH